MIESTVEKSTCDPHAERMKRVLDCVLFGPGTLDASIRKAAAAGKGVPEILASYVQKVQKNSYKVVDRDIEALRQAGYSEDQIFELTVSAALGAGWSRVEAGLKAVCEGGS